MSHRRFQALSDEVAIKKEEPAAAASAKEEGKNEGKDKSKEKAKKEDGNRNPTIKRCCQEFQD